MALSIEWTDEARSDIRALDRATAMRIFDGLYHYATTGVGDVKALKGRHTGKLRLRLGDHRVFFNSGGKILRILAVRNRSEAYR
jgi:mRNA-degrading endonuclease RelE of RelBE toxin-antitoxin system